MSRTYKDVSPKYLKEKQLNNLELYFYSKNKNKRKVTNKKAAIELENTINVTDRTVMMVVLIKARTTIPSFDDKTSLIFSHNRNFSGKVKSNS